MLEKTDKTLQNSALQGILEQENFMIKVLFICHGNICRSTMAEYVMKYLVRQSGLESDFVIDSAGTSNEEYGNPVHRGTQKKLREEGIPCGNHRARKMRKEEYAAFDYIICMERYNIQNIMRIIGSDPEHKVQRLLDYTDRPGDIADPWYTGNFDETFDDVMEGCQAFLGYLMEHPQ